MKRLLAIALAALLLAACADSQAKCSGDDNINTDASNSVLSENTESPDTGPSQTESSIQSEDASPPAVAESTDSGEETSFFYDYFNILDSRPDSGREVTIFSDNTSDCSYSGYKEIGYDFNGLRRSLMIPENWSSFQYYPVSWNSGSCRFENDLTGIPIYDGPLPFEIDYVAAMDNNDYSSYFDADPKATSTFYFAEIPWSMPAPWIGEKYINKYDHETYTDKKGRTMQVYSLDGLPKYAVYDDFFKLCICFNLKNEKQIPIAVNMINSIDVSLDSHSEWVLYMAEHKFGYTVIPRMITEYIKRC